MTHNREFTGFPDSGLPPVKLPNAVVTIRSAIWMAGVVLAILGIWMLSPVFLLIFCSILLAIVMDAAAGAIARPTGLPRRVGHFAALAIIFLLIYLAGRYFGPTLTDQFGKLVEQIEWGFEELRLEFQQAFGQSSVMESEEPAARLSEILSVSSGLFGGATATIMTVVGALGGFFLVVVMASYIALAPRMYLACILTMVPKRHRGDARVMIAQAGIVLRRWLLGQGVSMVLIGLLSYAGLLLLGVPLAFILAVFAALTAFVPIIGPVIGGIAMVLVAISDSWVLAAWTAGLYLLIQLIESYLLTPIVQRQSVFLLPAVVLAAQIIMSALFGLLGLALASPLTAIAMTIIFGDRVLPAGSARKLEKQLESLSVDGAT